MLYLPLDSPSFLLHALGLVLTAGVSLAVARWVDGQARDEAARAMVALLLVHAAMATLYLGTLLVEIPPIEMAVSLTAYGLILASPVLWFRFAVSYTDREHWLTTRVTMLLGASAVVPFAFAVTNPYHRLLVVDWLSLTEPFQFRQPVFSDLNGPFFLFVSLYVLTGFALVFRLSLFSRRSSRWQSVGLLVGMLAVQVPAVLSVTEYAPITNFPYGVFGSGVFGVIVALSLFHTRLFAVAPLAHDALFDSLDDAVVVVDLDRRLVDCNERALEAFPALDGQFGRPIDDCCPQLIETTDSAPDATDRTRSISVSGTSVTGPAETLTGADADTPFVDRVELVIDGEARSFNVTVSAIERGGRPRGYGLVASDVTDLVAYSTELERKTERLEQFASVLSHDLRNPLTVAMGRIELERDAADSDHLRTAERALGRIETTIDDLLTLARTGETVSDLVPLSLRTVAEDAWETSDTGSATLAVEVDGEYRMLADRSRLATLLENLFRNAADHGGERITVGPVASDGGTESGFFVADDGPGIPADERDRAFEYGYSTDDDGTGFGLAIVQSVAEAHGWSVAVGESDDGGARFEVTGVDLESAADAGGAREVTEDGVSGDTDW